VRFRSARLTNITGATLASVAHFATTFFSIADARRETRKVCIRRSQVAFNFRTDRQLLLGSTGPKLRFLDDDHSFSTTVRLDDDHVPIAATDGFTEPRYDELAFLEQMQ
jgi:hypothetical protein